MTRRIPLAASLLAAALVAAGCSGDDSSATGSSASGDSSFSVTIDHKFSATEITKKPERVL